MKQIILMLLISVGLSTVGSTDSNLYQKREQNVKPMKEKKIKHLDRKLTKHKAVKKNFKTKKEFLRKKNRKMHKHHTSYDRGYFYYNKRYLDRYHYVRQCGYKHSKRGWMLAYRYDRASFYDREGFYYGYFNKHGFYFENVFYRYDRYYTYKDRVRGRSLFDHRYYMPSNARYYGFFG